MTAVMLVTAPPIATSASGTGRPSMRERSAEIAAMASRSAVGRNGAVEPVALGVAHGADVDAEALVDARIVPEA